MIFKGDIVSFLEQNIKKYDIIYADPPWQFRDRTPQEVLSSKSQYAVMSIENLQNLNIPKISKDNCILYLWVPTSMIKEGLNLVEKWGFVYKTKLYWIKIGRLGTGYYYRNQVEECLVAIKGKIKPFHLTIRNYIEEKSKGHSIKPDGVLNIINTTAEKLGLNDKIELFARNDRQNWDSVGLEIPIELIWG
jgi:N6-adenosine-specific RNA methylase IME4